MTQSSTQARNWRDLIRPKALIEEDRNSHTDFYGKFVCEPLERGFGITIGNSLRRVLLSPLQGAAITAVRIDGALHEFTTIDDVKEDVADINLLTSKEVVFQASEAKRYTLRLEKEGAAEVLAEDIKVEGAAGIKVLNPRQHIATVPAAASSPWSSSSAWAAATCPPSATRTRTWPSGGSRSTACSPRSAR